jgi:hypothetical protein
MLDSNNRPASASSRATGAKRILGSMIVAAVLSTQGPAKAAQPSADIIARFDKSFWLDVAIALAPLKLGPRYGDLAIVDANLCAIDASQVSLLVVLSRAENASAPATTLWKADCQKTASELAANARYAEVEAVGKLGVSRLGPDGGLSVKVFDVAATQGRGLSDAELQVLRSASFEFGTLDFPIQILDFQDSIKVTPDVDDGALVLFLAHPQLSHPLTNPVASLADGFSATNNVRIMASHAAINFAFEKYLSKKSFAVGTSGFTVAPSRYAGSQDTVEVSAIVTDKAATSYNVSADWTGGNLKLSKVVATTRLSCSNRDFRCQASRVAQNLAGGAFAQLMLSRYGGSPMLPSTGANKIRFAVSGRNYLLGFSSSQTSALHDALSILANMYIEVAK